MIKKNQNAFTLIELIITIVIVSIISLIAIYAYEVYVEEAKATEIYTHVNTIHTAQNLYFMEKGHYANGLSYLSIGGDIGYYSILPGDNDKTTKDFLYKTWTDAAGTLFIRVEKTVGTLSPAPTPPAGVSAWFYGVAYNASYYIVFQQKKGERKLSYLNHFSWEKATPAEKKVVGRIVKRVTGETISTI